MAALPSIKRISREDVKEAPDWIDRLLYPLNQFMGSVYAALSKGLTHQENLRCTVKDLTFTTPFEYTLGDVVDPGFDVIKFPHNLRTKAIEVRIAQINVIADNNPVIVGGPVPNWIEIDGEIQVRYISGLLAETEYGVRFIVS